MMYTEEDIYIFFRIAQSLHFSRPYRLPKDFDKFMATRMSTTNKDILILITQWFNTKWTNIDPTCFFSVGFKLLDKKFTYRRFFDDRVLKYYITLDKIKKRDTEINKTLIKQSIAFIKKFLNEKNNATHLSFWGRYCWLEDDGVKIPLKHFINNDIDRLVFTWIIQKKYITLSDSDRSLVPLIIDNYRDYVDQVAEFKSLLEGCK